MSSTVTDPITNADGFQIAATRTVLSELADRVNKFRTDDTLDSYRLGQLHQAVTTAEEALFEVLNVASSCLDSEMGRTWLHVKAGK